MRKLCIAALILAMSVFVISDSAHSRRRTKQVRVPYPAATESQPKSPDDQRGTEQSPFVIKVIPAPTSNADVAKEERDRQEKAETDRKLAEYTGELAFFTKGLFIATVVLGLATIGLLVAAFSQSRDMKESIAVAKKAAEAALMQARAAVTSMRAHMAPGFPKPVAGVNWYIEIAVTNTGAAVGTIGDTHVCFSDDLPTVPDYSKAAVRQDSTILSAGQFKTIGTFPAPHPKDGIYCYGFIRFADEIGKWRRRFCVQIYSIPPAGKNFFHEVGGDAYTGEDQES
jgi:hypothetical protein